MSGFSPVPVDLTVEFYEDTVDELVSAEDFLGFFGVPFAQEIVHVNRLHIMQRYHDYRSRDREPDRGTVAERFLREQAWLAQAYRDFTVSDALTEKVFKVFRQQEPEVGFVSLDSIG